MDGTLVDSAEYHWQAVARHYVPRRFPDHPRTIPEPPSDSATTPFSGSGSAKRLRSELIQRIGNAKEALYRQHVREQRHCAAPGSLGVGKPAAPTRLGTGDCIGSLRANIETILDVLHASECFEAIVSADDVHRGKPDPEVFLAAASRLGVAPEHCIVVEDAQHGVEAARAAGMKSISVRLPELQALASRCGGTISRPSGHERLRQFVAGWRLIETVIHHLFLVISRTQPRHRVDANAKKERFDGILAYSHLPLAQRIQPPTIAFRQQRTGMLTFGCVLRLG